MKIKWKATVWGSVWYFWKLRWSKNCWNLLGCGSLDVASYVKLQCPGVLVGRYDNYPFIAQKTEMQRLKSLPRKADCSVLQQEWDLRLIPP